MKKRVFREDNYIMISVLPHYDYDINIDWIKFEGLDHWLDHLQGKNWWNKELEVDFIRLYNESQNGKLKDDKH